MERRQFAKAAGVTAVGWAMVGDASADGGAVQRMVRTYPLRAGKRDELVAFLDEVVARQNETTNFYRSYNVARESVHIQETAQGEIVIVCTDLRVPGSTVSVKPGPAAAAYAAWFKSKALALLDIDLDNLRSQQVTGQGLFDWRDPGTL